MLFGNISERPGGVFLASVHDGDLPLKAFVPGPRAHMVDDPTGSWVLLEDLNRRLNAHDAFPTLKAAEAWCASHFERAGEPVPDLEPGFDDGSWRMWPG